jgi:hypothetical protein
MKGHLPTTVNASRIIPAPLRNHSSSQSQ